MALSLPAKFALVSFVITLTGVVGVAWMAYQESDQLLQQEAVRNLSTEVQQEARLLESQAQLVRSDVAFLASSAPVKALIRHFSTTAAEQMDYAALQTLFSAVLVQREMYYQVRLIGVADGGRELVRVARLQRGISVVDKSQLMRKGKRAYFQAALTLKPGEFLFSAITLNREHGIITQPPQPMLRVSTALFDAQDHVFAVLLINIDFNVFAKSVHHRLDYHDGRQNFFIANSRGEYLVHHNPDKAMAFEYGRVATLGKDFQLQRKFLVNTQAHDDNAVDQYLFDDQGMLLMLGNVHFDRSHPERFLHIGGVFSLQDLRAQSLGLRNRMLWLTLMLAVFLAMLTYYVAAYFTRPIRQMIDAAVSISQGKEDVTMPVTGKDEIGLLSGALQQMVTHLRESQQRTDALNAALEVKVSKRTAQLARLAGELEAQNAQLEQAVLDAEQAAVAKSQFLATMSHEIRTPLNGVLGLTELVLTTELSAQQREYMLTVQSSGEALLAILNDILDFSKIEAGQMEIKAVEFNPNDVIEHVAKLFARHVNGDAAKVKLIARAIPVLPQLVSGDSDRLRQVMLNLMSNAIKFTETGEVVISAELLSESESELGIRFQVCDTGRGISEKDQLCLFDEFTQADGTDSRQHGGTGLGLAIVKRLVALMGGTIAVDSEIGRGSCFYFDLQLQKASKVVDGPHCYAEAFSHWRALVVDDHAGSRDVVSGLLSGWGMHCTPCSSSEQAMGLLTGEAGQSAAYDLILIDQMVGQVTGQGLEGHGMALAQWIKARPALRGLKVVMTTPLDTSFDAELRQRYGLDGFIRKPVYVGSLFETVLDVMGVRARVLRYQAGVCVQQRGEAILLAEDNAVNQQVAVGMLANQGFTRVDVVCDGVEALRLYRENSYALILMDVQMPECDGITATREVRALEARRESATHIPIIALTAHALDEDIQRTREAGMDAHLTKPLTGKALQDMLAQWLPQSGEVVVEGDVGSSGEAVVDAAGGLAAVDEAGLRQLRADMGFGIGMILDTYLSELPGQVEAIVTAVAASDSDALRRHAHRLKGASRSIAAAPLGDICSHLEQCGQQHDIDAAEVLLVAFRQAVDAVLLAFQAEWLVDVR